jgi:PAT family beta-lactamase induction signal transducer AmpG
MVSKPTSWVYLNRRMAALLGLGVASGLPYMLTQDSLSAWLTKAGVDVTLIGLLSLVTLPYSLKVFWAPWMDRFVPPWLGRRRGWLLLTQGALGLAILMMAWIGPRHLWALTAAALVVAFLSASQDIVTDAYRTDVLPEHELGAGAAVFVMGYRLALILSGAGILMLAGWWNWRTGYALAGLLMLLSMVVTWLAPEADREVLAPATMCQAILEPLGALFHHRRLGSVIALLAFILLFRLPDTLANRMTMPFLLDAMHYAVADIGVVRQFIGLGVTIVGTLIGGWIVSRLGIKRCLWLFGLLQAASNAGYLALSALGPDASLFNDKGVMMLHVTGLRYLALAGVVTIESFCGGLVTAGFLAFLMSQCDRRYSATQYALFTSLMTVTGSLLAAATGYMVAGVGYSWFFAITILTGLPGLMLITLLPPPLPREP